MTDKIISFQNSRLKKMGQTGEANFICCPKCKAEEWAVGVMSDGKAPFIYALVCISDKCGPDWTVLTVTNGVIEEQEVVA